MGVNEYVPTRNITNAIFGEHVLMVTGMNSLVKMGIQTFLVVMRFCVHQRLNTVAMQIVQIITVRMNASLAHYLQNSVRGEVVELYEHVEYDGGSVL